MIITKACSKCGIEKSISEFYKAKGNKDGHRKDCKKCAAKQQFEYYKANPEKHRATTKRYRLTHVKERKIIGERWNRLNPERRRRNTVYTGASATDRRKGRATCSRQEFFKIIDIGICHYCGDTEKIGVDRIDNSKGHIVGNMVPCCKICNVSRMDNFTVEEMKEIIGPAIAAVRERRKQ